jgi:nucleoside transporter
MTLADWAAMRPPLLQLGLNHLLMSDPLPDSSEALVAVPPPEQVALPPFTADDLTHVGVSLWSGVGAKLAMAMFLHHFALSSWIVTLGSYVEVNTGLGRMFAPGFVGIVYGAGPIGGMVAPFLTGLLADNFFATERIMAVLNLAGAVALFGAVMAQSQWAFYAALVAYFVCFIPSFALTASMTMHHLARPERHFPMVRAWSTAGWIAGGVFVGWFWPTFVSHGVSIEATITPLKVGAVGQLLTAAWCVTLPHTPPANKGFKPSAAGAISGSQTFGLLRQPRFLLLMGLAVIAHVPSQFYYAYANVFFNWAGLEKPAATMTLGQCTEVACMILLPMVLLRISVKSAILAGLTVWTARFWMLSQAALVEDPLKELLLYVAILVHGIAFTLVTISLQLDVDRCAGRRRRATAQGLLSVAMSGLGCFIGAEFAGIMGAWWIPDGLSVGAAAGWQWFWLVPAGLSAAVFAVTAVFLPADCKLLAEK